MERKEPKQNESFVRSKILWEAATFFEVITYSITLFQHYTDAISTKIYLIIIFVLTLACLVIRKYSDTYFNKASQIKLESLIEDSFGITQEHNDYYDTIGVQHGLKKLLANIHENSLYTHTISLSMKRTAKIKIIIIIFLFLLPLLYNGLTEELSIFANFILSANLISNNLSIIELEKESEQIFERCNRICLEYENSAHNYQLISSKIISLTIEYEKLLQETKVNLNSKTFHKLNNTLKENWTAIQAKYKIYSDNI